MSGIQLYAENIAANLFIPSQTQGFTFTTAINQYQIINNFIPTSFVSSQNALEFINANDAGYRFKQLTTDLNVSGDFILETFTTGMIPGTIVMIISELNFNTGIGYQVLSSNTTGGQNCAFGQFALTSNTNGSVNTAIGSNALFSNTAGYGNVGIGYKTLGLNITGYENVAVGSQSGQNQVLYTNCVFLGAFADATVNSLINAIAIGYGASVGASNSMVLGSGCNVGIGTSTPTYLLDVVGTTRAKKLLGNASAPTVVLGSAAGSSPSSTITGSELGGRFSVTTGSGAATGLIGTFTLSTTMPSSTFSVIFTAANVTTGSILKWEAATSSSTFSLNAITGLAASTTYLWNYQIIGY